MSEEESELVFDPSIKKKKKKKKTFDLDAALGETRVDQNKSGENDKLTEEGDEDIAKKKEVTFDKSPPDDEEEIDLQNFGAKKKKKKKKDFDLDDLGDALPDNQPEDTEDVDLENFGKKKKKKKRVVQGDGLSEVDGSTEPTALNKESGTDTLDSRLAYDADYTYDQLLERVFSIIKEKNPEMASSEKRKFVMRPPQVVKVGTKKTAFVNFTEIARMLHRQPKHLLSFLAAELGTVGAIDGSDQLIIKGRFQQKHMENVLRRYIKEYVTCHTCRSPDTILNKETRLFFLQCMSCHSRCSVQTIKTGFQAVTSKRSLNRNKQ